MSKSFPTAGLLVLLLLNLMSCVSKNEKPGQVDEGDFPKAPNALHEDRQLKLIEETDYQGNLLEYSIINSTGERHGTFVKKDAQGNLLEKAAYNMGELDGHRILFYPNQDTQIVETHVQGQYQGTYRSYYPGNQLKLQGDYISNKMQGTWKMYYEGGELKEEVTFVDNLENGPFVEYHKNGQVAVTGSYLNGDNDHGTLKFYREDGTHYKTMECNEGLCRTTWKLEEIQ